MGVNECYWSSTGVSTAQGGSVGGGEGGHWSLGFNKRHEKSLGLSGAKCAMYVHPYSGTHQKILLHTLSFLVFKIVESLQRIFK